jgi:poly(A) polymerase Pap1
VKSAFELFSLAYNLESSRLAEAEKETSRALVDNAGDALDHLSETTSEGIAIEDIDRDFVEFIRKVSGDHSRLIHLRRHIKDPLLRESIYKEAHELAEREKKSQKPRTELAKLALEIIDQT